MAYANGFNGDHVALGVILKVIQAKNFLVPGLISHPGLTTTVSGESAFFYTKGATTADASHNLGAATTTAVRGGKRIDIPITTGAKFDFVVPGPMMKTANSVEVLHGYLADETQHLLNLRQEAGITAIVNGAVAKTYAKNKEAWAAIVEAIAQYQIDNKVANIKPTAIMVSPLFWSKLLQDNKFIRSTTAGDMRVFGGEIGEVDGIPVIKVPSLSVDFVLINALGFAAPMNVHTFKTTQADAGGGTAYIDGVRGLGELGYNFKVVTSADEGFLDQGTGYFISKHTQASS